MESLTSTRQANEMISTAEKEGFKPILSNTVPLTQGVHTVTATGIAIARKITAKDGNKYVLIESQFQTDKGEKFYGAINDTSIIDELKAGMQVTVEVQPSKPTASGKTYMQASYKAVAQKVTQAAQ